MEVANSFASIGVDVGYKQSCAAYYSDYKVQLLPSENGNLKTPTSFSYSFNYEGQCNLLAGFKAEEAIKTGEKSFDEIKRLIGRSSKQSEIQQLAASNYFPFKFTDTDPLNIILKSVDIGHDDSIWHTEELMALNLLQLRQNAESHLKSSVRRAVIAVPARFNTFQKMAMTNAGLLAGFKEVEIITEATAAAIAHLHSFPRVHEDILVFDLGLCSFDLTLLKVRERDIYVRAAGSDTYFGGRDFTTALFDYVKENYYEQKRKTFESSWETVLKSECEEKMKLLSSQDSVTISYHGYLRGSTTVSRKKFVEINEKNLERCFSTLDRFLNDARFRSERIQRVLLVGGTTKIPAIQSKLRERFLEAEFPDNVDVETVIATGAAIHAAKPKFKEHGTNCHQFVLESIAEHAINGVITHSNIGICLISKGQPSTKSAESAIIIPKGQMIPCNEKQTLTCPFTTGGLKFAVYRGDDPTLHENEEIGTLVASLQDIPTSSNYSMEVEMQLSRAGILTVKITHVGWWRTRTQIVEQSFRLPSRFRVHDMQNLKTYADSFSESASQMWSSMDEIPTTDIYSADQIEVAKVSYQDHMEREVATFEPISLQEFNNHHEKAVNIALESISKTHPLTEDGLQEVRKPLDELYAMYLKLNERKQSNPCKFTVGVDSGTTCSSAAILEDGRVDIIQVDRAASDNGEKYSSYLVIEKDGTTTSGNPAKRLAVSLPESSIFDLKRMIGQHVKHPDIQKLKRYWPFIIINNNNSIEIDVHGRTYRPEDLLVKVIEGIKASVSEYLNEEMVNIVVAIPAYFNPLQKRLTKQAFLSAGLNVIKFVPEPIAAALAYYEKVDIKDSLKVLIFDLGGGTLDLAVVHLSKDEFNIIATDGDPFLGGQDFDNALADHCIQCFEKEHRINVRELPGFSGKLQRLRSACEIEKRSLSVEPTVRITVYAFHGQHDLEVTVKRETFNNLIDQLVKKCMVVVERITSKVSCNVDQIVLVGGSTRVPLVRKKLQDSFQQVIINDRTIKSDLAVASGAAILASRLRNKTAEYIDSAGVEKLVLLPTKTVRTATPW